MKAFPNRFNTLQYPTIISINVGTFYIHFYILYSINAKQYYYFNEHSFLKQFTRAGNTNKIRISSYLSLDKETLFIDLTY